MKRLIAALVFCNGLPSWTQGAFCSRALRSSRVTTQQPPPNVILLHTNNAKSNNENNDDELDLSWEAFEQAKAKMDNNNNVDTTEDQKQQDDNDDDAFDGCAFRDVLLAKWGACYDVDFNRVDSFGFRQLYLNVLPYHLGRRPWRHASELDYLCHLQAVVEILQKYRQLNYVLYQIQETNKKPLAGRSPIVAVPLRLDLTHEQVTEILGY